METLEIRLQILGKLSNVVLDENDEYLLDGLWEK
jgi:hypothetical protein